jgi:hypothetical protein
MIEDIYEVERFIVCPYCGGTMGMGTSHRELDLHLTECQDAAEQLSRMVGGT